jgi:glucose-6-phosphate 1-epimerase
MSSPIVGPNDSVNVIDTPFSGTLFGLPCLTLQCGESRVVIAQQGAQVLSWRDASGREHLYLSPETGGAKRDQLFDDGTLPQAIRGGMPICFPQFSGRGTILKHGFARACLWSVDAITNAHGSSTATFTLRDDEHTRAIWPEAFLAQLSVTLEPTRLIVTLSVTNNSDRAWAFTGALHTYFRVADIAKTALAGLQNTRYQDATADNVEVLERDSSIKVNAEVDRVYLSPPASLQLQEGDKPSLIIEQSGFTETVVWNPGPILVRTLKDFPDDDWRHMLCVEAACAAAPVAVQPGETWIGSQVLSIPSFSAS